MSDAPGRSPATRRGASPLHRQAARLARQAGTGRESRCPPAAAPGRAEVGNGTTPPATPPGGDRLTASIQKACQVVPIRARVALAIEEKGVVPIRLPPQPTPPMRRPINGGRKEPAACIDAPADSLRAMQAISDGLRSSAMAEAARGHRT